MPLIVDGEFYPTFVADAQRYPDQDRQCIDRTVDPPYGISFRSNFQPDLGNLQPEDKQKDLTREPETVKAYRDTWTLGVHSYLAYLRDRFAMARELLSDGGSLF